MIMCKPGTDCTNCPKLYEIETDNGVKQRCKDSELNRPEEPETEVEEEPVDVE